MYRVSCRLLWLPFILLVVFAGPEVSSGQSPASTEAGVPYFIQHFSPHPNPQNWSVVQDSSGVIYVGNNDGILMYDGVSWELIRTESQTIVRSLAVGPDGRVYVGQVGDLGVLQPDSVGNLRFASLIDEITPANQNFDDVWTTTVTDEGVYFQTSNQLFRWDGSTMDSWSSSVEYHTSFSVRDTLYVRIRDRGLYRMENDNLQLVPGGEDFSALHVFMMSPHRDGQILIGTRQEGLFLKKGRRIDAVDSDIGAILQERRAYHGRKITDNTYAVGTLGGGVLLITAGGEILDVLSSAHELPDNVVNYVYPDQQGGLWLALHNQGIVRVDVPTPLTVFKDDIGPEGLTYSIRRHQQTLFTATGTGVYYLDKEEILTDGSSNPPRFRKIPGIPSAWSLLSLDDVLLIGSQDGIYALDRRDENPRLISSHRTFTLRRDRANPDRIFAGTKDGLFSLTRSSGQWQVEPVAAEITEEIRSIVQPSNDTLWLATQHTAKGRILRLTLNRGKATEFNSVRQFGQDAGLPIGDIRVSSVDDQPLFTASRGMYRFDSSSETFVRRSPVSTQSGPDSLRALTEDNKGRLWMVYPRHVEIATPSDSTDYEIATPPALHIPYSPFAQIYVEETGVVWISGKDQLIRYDPTVQKDYKYRAQTLIRKIRALESGQTLFGEVHPADDGREDRIILPYTQNSIQINVAAPFYNRPEATRFQYQFSGTNRGWSQWDRTATYSFTNIDAGTHELQVHARNIHGIISKPATLRFRILAPWYQTWWAYFGYVILLGLGALMAVRYRRLVLEKQRAEQQRKELAREREINERLQAANDRLQEANEWKDSLVANISHELRTPLAAILGFSRILKDEVSGHHEEFLELIEGNGKRLQHTIDRLLDMSKLEAGDMTVQKTSFDLNECTRGVIESVNVLAARKNLELRIDIPSTAIDVHLDENKVEDILFNLIGNAIKFTEEGFVRVEIEGSEKQVHITVQDTGIGISEEFFPELFEPFTQESRGLKRTHEGTGLGLFLTARLVHLMEGTINIDSTKGEGTTVTVTFDRFLN
jgi:signal transduction histidine kinase